MSEIAKAYAKGEVRGWVGLEQAKAHFQQIAHMFPAFKLVGQTRETQGRKTMLYQVVRKLLGKDLPNVPQEIGDCTSHGAKHATEHCDVAQLLTNGGSASDFHTIFAPYFYGASRVLIGKGQIPANEDGSSGSWTAAAAVKYGALREDFQGVPKYSGDVAKQWGASGPPKQFLPEGQKHIVKSAAKITSWASLVDAVSNYYPVTIASDQAFQMMASSDGFHHPDPTTTWPHQMCVTGIDETYSTPYGLILNNWGDVHGQLNDFQTGESLPVGVLRATRDVLENMIASGELFAFSQFQDFREQAPAIDKALFKLI